MVVLPGGQRLSGVRLEVTVASTGVRPLGGEDPVGGLLGQTGIFPGVDGLEVPAFLPGHKRAEKVQPA